MKSENSNQLTAQNKQTNLSLFLSFLPFLSILPSVPGTAGPQQRHVTEAPAPAEGLLCWTRSWAHRQVQVQDEDEDKDTRRDESLSLSPRNSCQY